MDPNTRKEILSRIDQEQRPRTPLALITMGIILLISPFLPDSWVAGVGGWNGVGRIFVAFLFFYVAANVFERMRLSRAFRELVESFEAFNRGIYGNNYKEQRAAINLMIKTIATEDAGVRAKVLERLRLWTGEDFGEDRDAWMAWWEENRSGFRLAPHREEGGSQGGKSGKTPTKGTEE